MERFDVAIVGAGIFGLSAAWALRKRGMTVAVHDKIGVAAGASGGLIGALSPHMPEKWNPKKAFQLKALLGAETFWREIEAVSGQSSGYIQTGRLIPLRTPRARELSEQRAKNAKSLWQGRAEWRVIERSDYCEDAQFGLVYETLSAKLSPRPALGALSEALRRYDTQFFFGKSIAAETLPPARHVIYAAGSGMSAILPDFAPGFWSAVKGQSALLCATLPSETPIIFDGGTYVVPQGSGHVAVGSTSENNWTDPTSTDLQLDEVIKRATALVPTLAGAQVVEKWAGLRPRARLPDPVVGPLAGKPNQWVMSGGFKIGLGLGPLLGEALAAMICGETPDLPETFTLEHQLSR